MRRVRGGDIGMIFQEPMTSLNPVLTIGTQLAEAIRAHDASARDAARARARAARPRCASPSRPPARASIRTSFPAACASG